ncbi:MinD/ParA family protein [Desulfurispira natronophila]|uniref:Flagellar biosynthesis protein FlhG n=1 Tax=Desulfurispira natronophila TaxID=682562 RepID=A0A7W8DGM9_9BACT|nr:MinD/ParA family protein [Desulfurispira natronophila]MBB5021423.1 flagellar biosynthesis protein FlhG [Desulfurispira natronophila]
MNHDQATSLRNLAGNTPTKVNMEDLGGTRIIAITSGKGGVGKTNTAANLAFLAATHGYRVLVIDADLGLGNMDIVMGVTSRFHVGDVLRGNCSLQEALTQGPGGILILPGGSGLDEIARISDEQLMSILKSATSLNDFDLIIIDTGAGISDTILSFLLASPEAIVVTTPEPTAFSDAYAVIKYLVTKHNRKDLMLLVNMVRNASEGQQIHMKMNIMLKRFIKSEIRYAGAVVEDDMLRKCIRKQQLLSEAFPASSATKSYQTVFQRLFGQQSELTRSAPRGSFSDFFKRLVQVRRA